MFWFVEEGGRGVEVSKKAGRSSLCPWQPWQSVLRVHAWLGWCQTCDAFSTPLTSCFAPSQSNVHATTPHARMHISTHPIHTHTQTQKKHRTMLIVIINQCLHPYREKSAAKTCSAHIGSVRPTVSAKMKRLGLDPGSWPWRCTFFVFVGFFVVAVLGAGIFLKRRHHTKRRRTHTHTTQTQHPPPPPTKAPAPCTCTQRARAAGTPAPGSRRPSQYTNGTSRRPRSRRAARASASPTAPAGAGPRLGRRAQRAPAAARASPTGS